MAPSTTSLQPWTRKHLLGLEELSSAEIKTVLATARDLSPSAKSNGNKARDLFGRVVVNLFFEDSTRTRASFRLAAERLSADILDMSASGSSVSKGETLLDTARNIEAMGVDALVVRHNQSGAVAQLAAGVNCSVLNAGDGSHEHPTQGLLDAYTIAGRFGRDDFDLSGLNVAIVGDISNSRVARSNVFGLTKLGAKVTLVAPPTLLPASLGQLGCAVTTDFESVLADSDVINMLRVQFERLSGPAFPSAHEYHTLYGLTPARLNKAKKNTIVMHPGPMNRGLEIASEVADGPQSVILEQVKNGVAVRMACLKLVIGAAKEPKQS